MIVHDPAGAAPASDGARRQPGADALATGLTALTGMDAAALRAEWRRLYRTNPPPKLSRDLLELAVAWKLQERVLGGLGARARRQLMDLAGTLTTRSELPKPRQVSLRPGVRLVRRWGGDIHEIMVVEDGFRWRERTWKSLSAIAREMTGTRWSGPRFFGLDKAGSSGPRRGGAAVEAEAGA